MHRLHMRVLRRLVPRSRSDVGQSETLHFFGTCIHTACVIRMHLVRVYYLVWVGVFHELDIAVSTLRYGRRYEEGAFAISVARKVGE